MKTVYLIAGGAVAAAALLVYFGKTKQVGYAIGAGAVDLVDGVVTGTVETIGLSVGIPKTSKTQCEIDRENGDTWAASFSCNAVDFIKYAWS